MNADSVQNALSSHAALICILAFSRELLEFKIFARVRRARLGVSTQR